ncbi:MAG: DUF502 domain-containing protein [Ramlibacter sp.]|nr:DUF502 domain-containing protein [Ramlibacter sp.]MCW5649064.1 DUF502 domain-containing protein [Ramlibacter sp.]
MKSSIQHPVRTLLTGALALLPLAATVLVLAWILRFLSAWLGPESAFGRLLTFVGLGVTQSEAVGYLLGVVLLVACVYVFGLLVEAGLQRGAARLVNALVMRIPVVRTIYDVIQKLVALLAHKEEGAMRSMSPVWLHFGGKAEGSSTAVLGLLSTPQPVMLGGKPYVGVLVPTAPVPVGGGLLYVPPEWVEPAQVGMEGLTSIYVSMGVTSAQYLDKPGPGPA